jgi:hypothetical protein
VDRVFTVAANHVKDLGSIALLEAVILDDGSERYQDVVTTLLTAGTDRTLADRGRSPARSVTGTHGHRRHRAELTPLTSDDPACGHHSPR